VIESRAAEKLCTLVDHVQRRGYKVAFSGFTDRGLDALRACEGFRLIDQDRIYPTMAVAVQALHAEAHEGMDDERCPLLEVVRAANGEDRGSRP
jgi:hypothetical protein